MKVVLKSQEEIAIMREAGRIVALSHQAMREAVKAGVSTLELDQIAEAVLRDHNAIPAFLNYQPVKSKPPFPATITASINHELVHGIPSADRILQEGDIISLDIACIYEGFVGDAAFTMGVGQIAPAVQRLIDAAEETLAQAIKVAIPTNKISDIARATQKNAAKYGYSVAREYSGHGVGRKMHEAPQVPNWWSKKRDQMLWPDYELKPGMTFAIEPMLIIGKSDLYELDDEWTVVTKDHTLCAHVEHTIAITEGEPLILTQL
ncbi:type I methionyl aminopeptidase [Anaerolineales bacterium]